MPLYSAGQLIRDFRLRENISQEEFCDGICSVPTLSRIETCKQNPSKKVLEALLSRAGINVGIFNVAVSEQELQREKLEYKIVDMIAKNNGDFLNELNQYWDEKIEIDNLDKQFYILSKAIYKSKHGYSHEEVILDLLSALKITYPNFNFNDLPQTKFFTATELTILNNIAIHCHLNRNKDYSIKLFHFIMTYYEEHEIDADTFSKKYPTALFNFINCKDMSYHDKGTITLCDKGIDCCKKYNRLNLLPFFLYHKGYGFCNLGNTELGKVYIEQSLAIHEALGNTEKAAWLADCVNRHFNLDLSVKLELNPERKHLFLI